MKYNNISTIVDDVIDKEGNIDKSMISTIKKWANNIIKDLEVPTNYKHNVKLLKVKNGKILLDFEFAKIIQLAYRFTPSTPTPIRTTEVVEWTKKLYDGSDCELKITKECPKCGNPTPKCNCDGDEVHITYDVDEYWKDQNKHLPYSHLSYFYRHGGLKDGNGRQGGVVSAMSDKFILMKPSNHAYFNADDFVPGCLNLNQRLMVNNNVEFKYEHPYLYVNQKDGEVLMSYLTPMLDEDGYRMIPDDEAMYRALTWDIISNIAYREMNKATTVADRNFYKDKWLRAEKRAEIAKGEVNERLNTPDFMSWWDFLEQTLFNTTKNPNQVDYFGVKRPDVYGLTMDRLTNHD